jgi:hypothetical protein
LSYRSRDGEKMLFRDLVAHHYLPTIKDAAPNTRKNTASHLPNGTGVPVRKGHYAERAARSQLLFAFGKLPIGAIGRNEVQQWISQMAIDGYDFDTMRAKRSLLKTILQVAVDQGWRTHNAVDRARLPRPVEQPDEDRVVPPEESAQIRITSPAGAAPGRRHRRRRAERQPRLGPAGGDLGRPGVHRFAGAVVDRTDEGQALPQGGRVGTRVRPAAPVHRHPSAR